MATPTGGITFDTDLDDDALFTITPEELDAGMQREADELERLEAEAVTVDELLELAGDGGMFVAVDGRWRVSWRTLFNGAKRERVFDADDIVGLSALFEAHGVREVATSSSVDFPHEYGMPENTVELLTLALSWQQ